MKITKPELVVIYTAMLENYDISKKVITDRIASIKENVLYSTVRIRTLETELYEVYASMNNIREYIECLNDSISKGDTL